MQSCFVIAKSLPRFAYNLLTANFAAASTANLERARLTPKFKTAPFRQSSSKPDRLACTSAAKSIIRSQNCVSEHSLPVGNSALRQRRIDGVYTLPTQTAMGSVDARSVNNSAATADSEKLRFRGAFIVLEGIDRSGKSTQAQRLVDFLNSQGEEAELWRFPDRTTTIGRTISDYLESSEDLDDAAIHLLFSANRREKQKLLLQKLKAGTTLVVDRYAFSGVAYTAAKQIPNLDLDWCKGCDKGLPSPDVVLYFELSQDEAAKRGDYGKERYENREMQKQVLRRYEQLRAPNWRGVDAAQTADKVAQDVQAAVMPFISEARESAVPKLLW